MTTAQEVEEHANRIAMLGMGQSVVLLRQYAALIKTYADAVAENARLKAAMDKYSEDEMLLIERCAKVADAIRALNVERRIGGERRVSKGNKWRDECWNVLRSGTDRRKA